MLQVSNNQSINVSGPITVLYYEGILGLEIHAAVLDKLAIRNQRVIIPAEFKQDKTIVAVLEGNVKVLNSLGERAYVESAVA
ncbi:MULTISPECIES: DUF2375 family protein [Shewanella]|uniref:DUF2375 family protein n=2 Tax=Shewanella TaxID=22 RepID=A0A974XNV9_9GAMM|nr:MULTISPECIES: DUF2375 family protein [Shewanella]QSX30521.1 DUF2375 family protein [Shewanella cyperi]QSX37734.1 DUF2375 family protein [Shewanella sedimentimangrovi]QSX41300.1 DUF2375 family protein [Shewanella cyperi]